MACLCGRLYLAWCKPADHQREKSECERKKNILCASALKGREISRARPTLPGSTRSPMKTSLGRLRPTPRRATLDTDWMRARLVLPPGKELVTLGLGRDALDWFRKAGKGYQTRINAVLHAYKDAHSRAR